MQKTRIPTINMDKILVISALRNRIEKNCRDRNHMQIKPMHFNNAFVFILFLPRIAIKIYCILMLYFIVLYLSIITLFSGEINPAHRPVHHGYRKCSNPCQSIPGPLHSAQALHPSFSTLHPIWLRSHYHGSPR